MMSGYVTGRYPAALAEVVTWAQCLDDASVLPDLDDVFAFCRAAVTS
jgi:hypothetical protein